MNKVICEQHITTGCIELDCQHREPHEVSPEMQIDPGVLPVGIISMRTLCTDYMECYGGRTTRCINMIKTHYKNKERKHEK